MMGEYGTMHFIHEDNKDIANKWSLQKEPYQPVMRSGYMDYDQNLLDMAEFVFQYYGIEYYCNSAVENNLIGTYRLDEDRECAVVALVMKDCIAIEADFPMKIEKQFAAETALYCMRHNHKMGCIHFDLDYEKGKLSLKLNSGSIEFRNYNILPLDEAISSMLLMISRTHNDLKDLSKTKHESIWE